MLRLLLCQRLRLGLCLGLCLGLAPASGAQGPAGSAGIKPNVIKWTTASEKDSFGYDVYRGPSEDGPFAPLNPDVIPAAGTTDIPQHYEYVDAAIEPDTAYWYYIESISLTGERRRITPVYPSKPKPEAQSAK